jgi:hypothetical protein
MSVQNTIEESILELIKKVDIDPNFHRCESTMYCGFYNILKEKLITLEKTENNIIKLCSLNLIIFQESRY